MRKLRKRVSRSTRSADARSTSTRASIVVSTTAMPSPATAPIHEHLPPQVRKDRKEVGWTKGVELAKLARRDDQHFDCATWLHKARKLPKEDFRREVERELTGKETEPSELICFKVYKSQIPVIEQAIETAALMLGTDKSRGYCLELR